MSKDQVKENAEKALKAVDLWNLKNRACSSLSGGEKKRAIIASALSSEAEILMLDEPTSGLDAMARRKMWTVLREMVGEGRTILLTTHMMEEAEMLSDKIAIINKGIIKTEGTLQEIRGLAKEKFRVVIEGDLRDMNPLHKDSRVARFGNREIFYVKNDEEALELTRIALKKGLKAQSAPISLEDIFVELVGGEEPEH